MKQDSPLNACVVEVLSVNGGLGGRHNVSCDFKNTVNDLFMEVYVYTS